MAEPSHGADPSAAPFLNVPVTVRVLVGSAEPTVGELLGLARGSVIPLDRRVEDPVTLVAGDRVIAYGELQVSEDDPEGKLTLRILEVVSGAADA